MALGSIEEANYKIWQQRLATSKLFRYWWQFWSNYAFVFYVIAGVYLLSGPDLPKLVWLALTTFLIARFMATVIINFFYKKQRPYQKFNFEPLTSKFFSFRTDVPNSFPSRHVISFSAVAVAVLMFNPLIGLALLVVTIMTGVARVVLGYHWPIDIVVALIIGTIIGYFGVVIGLSLFFT